MVERFFRELTEKQISRGVFRSVVSSRQQFWARSRSTTSTPSRTFGPPRPPTSSKRWNEHASAW